MNQTNKAGLVHAFNIMGCATFILLSILFPLTAVKQIRIFTLVALTITRFQKGTGKQLVNYCKQEGGVMSIQFIHAEEDMEKSDLISEEGQILR